MILLIFQNVMLMAKNNTLKMEISDETRFRIVSDYGYEDKVWLERMLTKKQVRDWIIKNTKWTDLDYETVGFEYFMNKDGQLYIEIDDENDEENWKPKK
jgi:hypothetical protein